MTTVKLAHKEVDTLEGRRARVGDVDANTGNRRSEIALQPASLDIWDKKYRLKRKDGEPVDESIDDTYRRVARALSEVENTPDKRELWFERFLFALRQGAIPAGRIVSNAGALAHKPA